MAVGRVGSVDSGNGVGGVAMRGNTEFDRAKLDCQHMYIHVMH